jgi:hypothetical protein
LFVLRKKEADAQTQPIKTKFWRTWGLCSAFICAGSGWAKVVLNMAVFKIVFDHEDVTCCMQA